MYNVLCILFLVYTLARCLYIYIYTTLKELYMVLYSPSYGLTLAAWFLPRKQPRSFCSMRLLQFGTNIGLEHKRYTTNFLVCGILNEIKKTGINVQYKFTTIESLHDIPLLSKFISKNYIWLQM